METRKSRQLRESARVMRAAGREREAERYERDAERIERDAEVRAEQRSRGLRHAQSPDTVPFWKDETR